MSTVAESSLPVVTVNPNRETTFTFVSELRYGITRMAMEQKPEYATYVKDVLLGTCPVRIVPVSKKGIETWNQVCVQLSKTDEMVLVDQSVEEVVSTVSETTEEPKQEASDIIMDMLMKSGKEIIKSIDYNAIIKFVFENDDIDKLTEFLLDQIMSNPFVTKVATVVPDISKLCLAEIKEVLYDPETKECFANISKLTPEQKSMVVYKFSEYMPKIMDIVDKYDINEIVPHIEPLVEEMKKELDDVMIEDAEFEVVNEEKKAPVNFVSFDNLKSFVTDDTGELKDTRDPWIAKKEEILKAYPSLYSFIEILDQYGLRGDIFVDNTGTYFEVYSDANTLYNRFMIDNVWGFAPFVSILATGVPYPVKATNKVALDKIIRGIPLNLDDVNAVKHNYNGAEPNHIAIPFKLATIKPFKEKMQLEEFRRLCGNLINLKTYLDTLENTAEKPEYPFEFKAYKSAGNFTLTDRLGKVEINFTNGKSTVLVAGKDINQK